MAQDFGDIPLTEEEQLMLRKTAEMLGEVVAIIEDSALSEGKKMAYLYAIADGSFSVDHFDSLLRDMKAAGDELQKIRQIEAARVRKLEREIEKLEKQLPELEFAAAKESERNLHIFEEAVHRAAEQSTVERHRKQLDQ